MKAKQLQHAEIFSLIAFIFFIIFIFYQQANVSFKGQIEEQKYTIEEITEDIDRKLSTIGQLRNTIGDLNNEVSQLQISVKTLRNDLRKARDEFPSQITIKNADSAFDSGKANLTRQLKQYIQNDVVPQIILNFERYDVNVIEVIGHTDSEAVKKVRKEPNLDENLNIAASNSRTSIDSSLQAGSNTDLGLMRALAVIKALETDETLVQFLKRNDLEDKPIFRAYSAAQLYDLDGNISVSEAKADPKRRRIEVRFTYYEES